MTRPHLLNEKDRPPEPSQTRSREKRKRLKTAALALFGEKGYDRTSVEDIAREADLAVGTFYQHFRSKKQLLQVLMDDLLENLSQLDLRPKSATDIRAGLRTFLARALSTDLEYLGAYRAWREAVITDPELAKMDAKVRVWSKARVLLGFTQLQQLPGTRRGVDLAALAGVMDVFFWDLLGQAVTLKEVQLNAWIDSATHLIFHALFEDPVIETRKRKS